MTDVHTPNFDAVYTGLETPLTVFVQICNGVYPAVMLRRVYAANVWYGVMVAVATAWSFFHIVWLYRFLQFVITLHTV